MLRAAGLVFLALAGLCGPAGAGVLSDDDRLRVRDYNELVAPASRERPALCDLATAIDVLIDAGEGGSLSGISELAPVGGPTLEWMLSSLQRVAGACTAPEQAALLVELRAEIAARLAYDAELIGRYRRNVAAGAPGLGPSFVRWEERPDTAARRSRFEALLGRMPECR
jgi:hypothetical protein